MIQAQTPRPQSTFVIRAISISGVGTTSNHTNQLELYPHQMWQLFSEQRVETLSSISQHLPKRVLLGPRNCSSSAAEHDRHYSPNCESTEITEKIKHQTSFVMDIIAACSLVMMPTVIITLCYALLSTGQLKETKQEGQDRRTSWEQWKWAGRTGTGALREQDLRAQHGNRN